MRNVGRFGLTGALVAGLSLVATTAGATPAGPGVTGKIIAQRTVGGTNYILREITVPPGQSTGWHYHDGTLYGVVKQGTLSHFDSTCAPERLPDRQLHRRAERCEPRAHRPQPR